MPVATVSPVIARVRGNTAGVSRLLWCCHTSHCPLTYLWSLMSCVYLPLALCFYLLANWLIDFHLLSLVFIAPRSPILVCFLAVALSAWLYWFIFPPLSIPSQRLFVPRERGRPDAARALSSRRSAGSGNPSSRPSDPHPEPRRGGVCRHHQHLNSSRVHRREGLRQGVGHQPTRKQEPHGPAGLSGETWKKMRHTQVLKNWEEYSRNHSHPWKPVHASTEQICFYWPCRVSSSTLVTDIKTSTLISWMSLVLPSVL